MHGDVIKWKYFPRHWPFVRGIHRWPVNSPDRGQWRGVLVFSLICVWINGWINNREAGDLRNNRSHYDVTVMGMWNVFTHTFRNLNDDLTNPPLKLRHGWVLTFYWDLNTSLRHNPHTGVVLRKRGPRCPMCIDKTIQVSYRLRTQWLTPYQGDWRKLLIVASNNPHVVKPLSVKRDPNRWGIKGFEVSNLQNTKKYKVASRKTF